VTFEGDLDIGNDFIFCTQKYSTYNIRSQLQWSDVTRSEELLSDAERKLLAIAEFLVYVTAKWLYLILVFFFSYCCTWILVSLY